MKWVLSKKHPLSLFLSRFLIMMQTVSCISLDNFFVCFVKVFEKNKNTKNAVKSAYFKYTASCVFELNKKNQKKLKKFVDIKTFFGIMLIVSVVRTYIIYIICTGIDV